MYHTPLTSSQPPLDNSLILEFRLEPVEPINCDPDSSAEEYDPDRSIVLLPIEPRRKTKENPYSNAHHVPHCPEPKGEPESGPDFEFSPEDFGPEPKTKPYSPTHHIPHSLEAEAGIPPSRRKAESAAESTTCSFIPSKAKPYSHTCHIPHLAEAELKVEGEEEALSEGELEIEPETTPEEFLAELENLSSIPFRHVIAARILSSWTNVNVSDPEPADTSFPFILPAKEENGNANATDDEETEKLLLEMETEREGRVPACKLLIGQEELRLETCSHYPFSLSCCCGSCGGKGRILIGTGRGGSSMEIGRRISRNKAEDGRSDEYGYESGMMCSECCTCGSYSGQLVMPKFEAKREHVKDVPEEELGPQKRSSRFGERRLVPGGEWSEKSV